MSSPAPVRLRISPISVLRSCRVLILSFENKILLSQFSHAPQSPLGCARLPRSMLSFEGSSGVRFSVTTPTARICSSAFAVFCATVRPFVLPGPDAQSFFHLLLRTGLVPISNVMRRLLTGYAGNFNLRHGYAATVLKFEMPIGKSCGGEIWSHGCGAQRALFLGEPGARHQHGGTGKEIVNRSAHRHAIRCTWGQNRDRREAFNPGFRALVKLPARSGSKLYPPISGRQSCLGNGGCKRQQHDMNDFLGEEPAARHLRV